MESQGQRLLPQLPLDDLLGELQVRLDAVRAARDGVHALLDAVVAIGRELDLETVLRRIVEAAISLVDARFGALGVIGDHGQLARFIPVGVTEDEISAIEEWPHGRGLLGLLIKEPQTLRLSDIRDHPESYGFPAGHPPMRSFLGVPITVRDDVFGNLYLTEKSGGRDFDEQDEAIVHALATAAGVAIENARLYAETRQRETWLDASAELTRALLSGADAGDALRLVASRAHQMSDGEVAAVMIRSENEPDKLRVVAVDGEGYERLAGSEFPFAGTLVGSIYSGGVPRAVTSLSDVPYETPLLSQFPAGPIFLVPLGEGDSVRGVLAVGKSQGQAPFASPEMRLLEAFAGQATVVLELADARREAERYSLIDDRSRIARDLHDLVIQRLFATAMTLTGAARLIDRPEAAGRIHSAVDDLDETIQQIRSTIFALQSSERASTGTLRSRVVEVVEAVTAQLGFTPGLRMDGLLDTDVLADVGDDVVAVLQEGLSNVVRHARASRADVVIKVGQGQVRLEVSDDGIGIADDGRRSGLANLAERADRRGGALEIRSNGSDGTVLVWQVPIS